MLHGDEDKAWQGLLESSQHANIPLRQVADAVISAAGEPLPPELQTTDHQTVDHVKWERRRSTTTATDSGPSASSRRDCAEL